MTKEIEIISLRIAVCILGEKADPKWWNSNWFSTSADSFLKPVFGNEFGIAIYHGSVEASKRVHDERIGVGRVFHLFRLPEEMELKINSIVLGENCAPIKELTEPEQATNFIEDLSLDNSFSEIGPIRVGSFKDLIGKKWIKQLASNYKSAFENSKQTFPYYTELQ
mgnify:FL=1|jgi:hypothetical protein